MKGYLIRIVHSASGLLLRRRQSDGDRRLSAGRVVTLTGHGYRSGESVAFALGTTPIGSAIASSDGDITLAAQVPVGTSGGKNVFSAVGAGSGFTSTVTVNVRGSRGA